jgi:hypothetical protein
VRQYLLLWGLGTSCVLAVALLILKGVPAFLTLDGARVRTLVILAALLALPLGRVGLAPASLARNRHR